MEWETVIGLEIHIQLSTRSKMFSGASIAFGAPPNTQASAVDLAMPGTLPRSAAGPMTRAAYLRRNYVCLRCGKTGSD